MVHWLFLVVILLLVGSDLQVAVGTDLVPKPFALECGGLEQFGAWKPGIGILCQGHLD